jgi:hypothetical protein
MLQMRTGGFPLLIFHLPSLLCISWLIIFRRVTLQAAVQRPHLPRMVAEHRVGVQARTAAAVAIAVEAVEVVVVVAVVHREIVTNVARYAFLQDFVYLFVN